MIPFPTTRIQLLSPGSDDTLAEDWGGAPDPATGYAPVGLPVRAHMSLTGAGGSGYTSTSGGESVMTYRLICDPCDISPGMRVRDLGSNVEYDVTWCMNRPGPIPHAVAGLTYSTSTA